MGVHLYNESQLKKGHWKALFTCLLLIMSWQLRAQEITVTGTVRDADDGNGIPGVNVSVKGTQYGTITDSDGGYRLAIEQGATLIFSFIGYTTEEIPVGSLSVVDVRLHLTSETLGEVVVTALGIERDERSLGYSVGEIKGDDMNGVVQENVLNGMAGRVAGVSVSSTGDAGSSVYMTIRGTTSLTNGNQPLFVIDGVPVVNSVNNVSQIGSDNNVDYGNPISDLDPSNIESVSILKGPSAAALYGSRAGNGVVLITTKSGSNGKKVKVTVNSNTLFDIPYKFLPFHHKFASGTFPYTPDVNPNGTLTIEEGSSGGAGPELDMGYDAIQWNSPEDSDGNKIATPLVSHKNNVQNFVQTGITTNNGVSLSNRTDKIAYRVAYSNMSNRGIIPNSDLFKNALAVKTDINASEKLTLSTNLNVTRSNSNNRPAGNRGTNPMQWAYNISPHIDIRDLKNYWVPGQEGLQQLTPDYVDEDDVGGTYNNPYFLAYEVNNSFVRDRVYGNLKAEWQIMPKLKLMGRYSLDTYNEERETKIANSYTDQADGAYGIINIKQFERNTDFLLTYEHGVENFSLTASVGGNVRYSTNSNVSNGTADGTGLITPGLYTLSNIAATNLEYSSEVYEKEVNSVYGVVNLGYKDVLYMDLTARNDWSSTLPKSNRSYFYPSVSVSALLNEILNMPSSIDLFKFRGGVAAAGNDTDPYQLFAVMENLDTWDGITRLSKSDALRTSNLKPETAISYEGGIDLGLFNRLQFSGTYYYVESKNQILDNSVAPSTGYSTFQFNAGLVTSQGIELTLGGTAFDVNGLKLDASVNFSKNISTIESLSDGQDYFQLWSDAKGAARTYVGDRIGNIYGPKLVTVTDKDSEYYGYPLLDDEGSWQSESYSTVKNKIGNFNPDFLAGMQARLSYKQFSLTLSFDWRSGGQFVSQTFRYAESDLKTQRFLDGLIDPDDRSGDELRNWLVNHEDKYIKVHGNQFNIVGGPTAKYGGFDYDPGNGDVIPTGVFNPGVIGQYDSDGNITGYTENLGGDGTIILPYSDDYPWSFTQAALFNASFVKLREISFGYALSKQLVTQLGLQAVNVGIYSRNIMLWTAAKIGVDPERAFQPSSSAQNNGVQFAQGIERYNVTPRTIPVGFKLNVTF